ncbi:MAG: RagB/SusD family nutrient uptake outer membrane protein, partial [Muribaculaceae bacterium]|nr:RagB/SusD family nutrient uptake outer membrane protein [Muribaculaceae bacterium]
GVLPGGKLYSVNTDGNLKIDNDGNPEVASEWEEEDYSDRFLGFTGKWNSTGGNAIVKFTNRTMNEAKDGGWAYSIKSPAEYVTYNGIEYRVKDEAYQCDFPETPFSSTSQPVIRLADIYLMYTECNIHGNCGDRSKALQYMNLVRRRAGAPEVGYSEMTRKGIMDERSRELYLEMTRRTDLVRNKMFSGPTQTVWQYKGSANNNEGTRIAEHMSRYPVPYAVIAAQPDFEQNPGY